MKTETIITPENQALLNLISNTGKSWFEMPLPDHPLYPQFSRKLVVTGFNTPDMGDNEDRIYVYVRQHLILKESNTVHKKLKLPEWMINEGNMEEIIGVDGNLLTKTVIVKDDEDNIISSEEVPLKAQSVQYVRFLIKSKTAYLTDVLGRFMTLYAQLFETKINDL